MYPLYSYTCICLYIQALICLHAFMYACVNCPFAFVPFHRNTPKHTQMYTHLCIYVHVPWKLTKMHNFVVCSKLKFYANRWTSALSTYIQQLNTQKPTTAPTTTTTSSFHFILPEHCSHLLTDSVKSTCARKVHMLTISTASQLCLLTSDQVVCFAGYCSLSLNVCVTQH